MLIDKLFQRNSGEIRYAVASESGGDLSRVLGKFGLKAEKSLLQEVNRGDALRILTELLWKDMAYSAESLPRAQAEWLANELIEQHANVGSKFFSNSVWGVPRTWSPLTESTFDSGLIISRAGGCYCCIWFEDED
jgi:hypothetical protein